MPAPINEPSDPTILAITQKVIWLTGSFFLFVSLQLGGSIELTGTMLHWAIPAFFKALSKAFSSETGLTAFPLVTKKFFRHYLCEGVMCSDDFLDYALKLISFLLPQRRSIPAYWAPNTRNTTELKLWDSIQAPDASYRKL